MPGTRQNDATHKMNQHLPLPGRSMRGRNAHKLRRLRSRRLHLQVFAQVFGAHHGLPLVKFTKRKVDNPSRIVQLSTEQKGAEPCSPALIVSAFRQPMYFRLKAARAARPGARSRIAPGTGTVDSTVILNRAYVPGDQRGIRRPRPMVFANRTIGERLRRTGSNLTPQCHMRWLAP